jgi:DNA (cytosine-5)-methyltransferase 1
MSNAVAVPAFSMIDLFAGCGGGSIGFRQAGFSPVAAVEIDKVAADAYSANIGVEPIAKNIRTVTGADVLEVAGLKTGRCTVLFGCPPCQSFTNLRKSSKALGRDRRRNTLYLEYLRIVDDVRPRHIAFENVPGMLSMRWRPHFDALLDGLTDLGYKTKWTVLDAADYGVPQRRKRILVVASRVTTPLLPKPTHFENPEDRRRRRHRTVWDTIGDCIELESGYYDPEDPYHEARNHSALALRRLRAIPEGGGRDDLPERLQLKCHKGHNGHHDIYGRMSWDRLAPTLTSGCTNITKGRFAHPDQDRAITLREAMLLQSFPMNTELRGGYEQMALQIGNAIPPLLARRIGETIMRMEERSRCRSAAQFRIWPSATLKTRRPSRSNAAKSLTKSST